MLDTLDSVRGNQNLVMEWTPGLYCHLNPSLGPSVDVTCGVPLPSPFFFQKKMAQPKSTGEKAETERNYQNSLVI
jgi:hypothetical protein